MSYVVSGSSHQIEKISWPRYGHYQNDTYYKPPTAQVASMAKSTFFLRGQVTTDHTTQLRVSDEIDLGAYVNLATSKPQLLRIHSIQTQVCDADGLVPAVDAPTGTETTINAFLNIAVATKETTLGTGDMPQLFDDSVIFTSSYTISNQKVSGGSDQGIVSDALDLAPQFLVNGILVGVDTLYLYALGDDAFAENVNVNFCMECSVEPATRENAINLALSQS